MLHDSVRIGVTQISRECVAVCRVLTLPPQQRSPKSQITEIDKSVTQNFKSVQHTKSDTRQIWNHVLQQQVCSGERSTVNQRKKKVLNWRNCAIRSAIEHCASISVNRKVCYTQTCPWEKHTTARGCEYEWCWLVHSAVLSSNRTHTHTHLALARHIAHSWTADEPLCIRTEREKKENETHCIIRSRSNCRQHLQWD